MVKIGLVILDSGEIEIYQGQTNNVSPTVPEISPKISLLYTEKD